MSGAGAARVRGPGVHARDELRPAQRATYGTRYLLDTITDLTNKSNITRTPYSGGVYRLPPAR